jgi:MFS transporter, DHA1 family, multidrug resistance protein
MAYMADITSQEDRSKGVGMMGAAMGLGMVMGPALGGVLTHVNLALPEAVNRLLQITTDVATGDKINLSIPFFASALLALVAMPLIQFMLPESLTPEKRAEHAAEIPTGESRLKGLLSGLRGAQGFLFVMTFLLSFALANMESVLGLYGNQRFQMGPSEIGIVGFVGMALAPAKWALIVATLIFNSGNVLLQLAALIYSFQVLKGEPTEVVAQAFPRQ